MGVSTHRGWYSIVRYLPDITRGEFVNVGVVLVCTDLRYRALKHLPSFAADKGRLRCFDHADGHFVHHAMTKLSRSLEVPSWVDIDQEESSALGWFTRLASTFGNNIRLSEPGLVSVSDPEQTLNVLFGDMVGQEVVEHGEPRLSRTTMRQRVKRVFHERGIFQRFGDHVHEDFRLPLPTAPRVDLAYRNGVHHFYQVIPLSEDESSVSLVYSYRMVVSDARTSQAPAAQQLSKAKFSVFGRVVNGSRRAKALRDTLDADGIEVLDFETGAQDVAETIARELATIR